MSWMERELSRSEEMRTRRLSVAKDLFSDYYATPETKFFSQLGIATMLEDLKEYWGGGVVIPGISNETLLPGTARLSTAILNEDGSNLDDVRNNLRYIALRYSYQNIAKDDFHKIGNNFDSQLRRISKGDYYHDYIEVGVKIRPEIPEFSHKIYDRLSGMNIGKTMVLSKRQPPMLICYSKWFSENNGFSSGDNFFSSPEHIYVDDREVIPRLQNFFFRDFKARKDNNQLPNDIKNYLKSK